MKKKLIKSLCTLGLIVSLFSISANAAQTGWVKHSQLSANEFSWEYIYSDGTPASEWQMINGDWYYFDPYGGTCYTGKCYWDANGNLAGDISRSWYNINGKTYWFDKDGKMLSDCNVCTSRAYYHLDSNGNAIRL